MGIDGVSIGWTNDLTMLILGVDRDNARVAHVYNELDPAVLWALEKTVTTCKKMGISCSICGQAPSVYPELVDMLTTWGVTSVSVSPDVLEKTRKIVYESEKKLLVNNHAKHNSKAAAENIAKRKLSTKARKQSTADKSKTKKTSGKTTKGNVKKTKAKQKSSTKSKPKTSAKKPVKKKSPVKKSS